MLEVSLKRRGIVIALTIGLCLYNILLSDPELSRRQLGSDAATLNGEPAKSLNILTLGGSVTWGAVIDDREQAYPSLIKKDGHNVVNLAIRGHGSDYPAQCIYSMVNDEEWFDSNIIFDVIILEFSINGLNLISLLTQRLQDRYPDALFIYVDLYTLIRRRNPKLQALISKVEEDVGAHIYSFPTTTSEDAEEKAKLEWLYAEDKHHINHEGHKLVRDNVERILSEVDIPEEPTLGSWHGGDTCHDIFGTGQIPFKFTGDARINKFNDQKTQFAVEVGMDGAVIEYHYDGKLDTEITLGYMTKCIDELPSSTIYPPVVTKVVQTEEMIEEARRDFNNGDVHILLAENDGINPIKNGWSFLDSISKRKKRRVYHQSETSVVGVVKPGVNYIYIQPLEKKKNPFRVTATVICEACKKAQQGNAELEKSITTYHFSRGKKVVKKTV